MHGNGVHLTEMLSNNLKDSTRDRQKDIHAQGQYTQNTE